MAKRELSPEFAPVLLLSWQADALQDRVPIDTDATGAAQWTRRLFRSCAVTVVAAWAELAMRIVTIAPRPNGFIEIPQLKLKNTP
jgi:hypothetical protein